MNKNTLIVSIAIIFGFLILGGFYYAVQSSKQASIERQQQVEIMNAKILKQESKKDLQNCLDVAGEKLDKMRKDYCKLDNKTILEDGTCFLSKERVGYINERKTQESDICFKKYPQT